MVIAPPVMLLSVRLRLKLRQELSQELRVKLGESYYLIDPGSLERGVYGFTLAVPAIPVHIVLYYWKRMFASQEPLLVIS